MFMESPNGPLWGTFFTALLLTGCVTDVRERRIPNALVVVIIAGGLGFSLAARPVVAAASYSLSGLVLGFIVWIVFYIAGVIGAGDVKFFSAAGTWLGPSATWRAALVAGVAGGVLAVFFLLRERRLADTIRRMALAASSGSVALLSETPESQASRKQRLPYGVALAVGALVVGWVPRLLG